MKLHLHHVEICTQKPDQVVTLLKDKFRFQLVGIRDTSICSQSVLQSGETVFIVTFRKSQNNLPNDSSSSKFRYGEPWTNFCCTSFTPECHIDSVFNVALLVKNLDDLIIRIRMSGVNCQILQEPIEVDNDIRYATVTSICGNVVHTLIQKPTNLDSDWFLPGFTRLSPPPITNEEENLTTTHLDHVALVCRMGDINATVQWYQNVFGMKRFITNRSEDIQNGLSIGMDVGMRLKVMEFWRCSEVELESWPTDEDWKTFKLVIVESLPDLKFTQIENFIRDHNGPGLQHIGLHSSNITKTVDLMIQSGVKFRQPPPTYYTDVGQLEAINSVGEDIEELKKFGILLDNEADANSKDQHDQQYLMQIFTFPVLENEKDTFFLEILQRKGARGFGIGNVTALARSITAYHEQLRISKIQDENHNV